MVKASTPTPVISIFWWSLTANPLARERVAGLRWQKAWKARRGRHVDLVNPHYIRNPYFLQAVNSSRSVIYDRQDTQAAG